MNKQSALLNIFILIGMPCAALIAGFLLASQKFWFLYLAFSFVLIFVGKLSQFRKGNWISFGGAKIDSPYKYCYWLGWFLLTIALVVGIATIAKA